MYLSVVLRGSRRPRQLLRQEITRAPPVSAAMTDLHDYPVGIDQPYAGAAVGGHAAGHGGAMTTPQPDPPLLPRSWLPGHQRQLGQVPRRAVRPEHQIAKLEQLIPQRAGWRGIPTAGCISPPRRPGERSPQTEQPGGTELVMLVCGQHASAPSRAEHPEPGHQARLRVLPRHSPPGQVKLSGPS